MEDFVQRQQNQMNAEGELQFTYIAILNSTQKKPQKFEIDSQKLYMHKIIHFTHHNRSTSLTTDSQDKK